MKGKKKFIFSIFLPSAKIGEKYPKTIDRDKKIIGYRVYEEPYISYCFCLPLCIKLNFCFSKEPIYE